MPIGFRINLSLRYPPQPMVEVARGRLCPLWRGVKTRFFDIRRNSCHGLLQYILLQYGISPTQQVVVYKGGAS
jgi:hypothetical protein